MPLADFLPTDATTPASTIAPDEATANLVAEGLDPNYAGGATMVPATGRPWFLYALFAVGIYFLLKED